MKSELAKLKGGDQLTIASKMDDYLAVVNQEPPKAILRNHPMASGVKYIPIEIIEAMMTKVFQDWYVEVLKTGQLLNSIEVTVRVYYMHPLKEEWRHQDGVGASPIQTNKGKSAADLAEIKNNAIMLALPAAKSYAIKDAVEEIGKLFGRDLNRKDAMGFDPAYSDRDKDQDLIDEAIETIGTAKNVVALHQMFKAFKSTVRTNETVIKAKDDKKAELENA